MWQPYLWGQERARRGTSVFKDLHNRRWDYDNFQSRASVGCGQVAATHKPGFCILVPAGVCSQHPWVNSSSGEPLEIIAVHCGAPELRHKATENLEAVPESRAEQVTDRALRNRFFPLPELRRIKYYQGAYVEGQPLFEGAGGSPQGWNVLL